VLELWGDGGLRLTISRHARSYGVARVALSILFATSFARGAEPVLPTLTHGVASGDVTDSSAVIWAAVDRPAELHVRVKAIVGSAPAREVVGSSAEPPALTATANLFGLEPGTDYRYEVWFTSAAGSSAVEAGRFTTAPAASVSRAVSFIWSGDLGGQKYCRRERLGYPIFGPMAEFAPDFFVANGDMIYADNECPAEGPQPDWKNVPGEFKSVTDPSLDWTDAAAVDAAYAGHWRYNRADEAFQNFLRGTSMYVQWDDHEVTNDFAARSPAYPALPERAGFAQLVAAGRRWLFAFHPIARDRAEPDRIYRSVRWGRELELFILDARSYRSENALEDSDANAKTILGAEQRAWLESGLARSTATWKFVSSDVPLSVPTGSAADARGRDAFASGTGAKLDGSTGFERELVSILKALDRKRVRNVVFIATDVHFAAQLRYARDFDGDGEPLVFHELVAGPLSAVRNPAPPAFDPTLGPVVLYAEGNLFNFGTVRVEPAAPGGTRLYTDVRDESGAVRPGSELELAPQR
jgi:alkaline phosphatase D